MSRRVLVIMDSAEASERALEHATEVEEQPDTRISVVHATATSDPLGFFGTATRRRTWFRTVASNSTTR